VRFRGRTRWAAVWWLGCVAALAGAPLPAGAQEARLEDMVGEVIEGCPRQSDPAAYQVLERKILGRIREAMRMGMVREALSATEALESCRRRQARTRDFDPEQIPPLLREVHCFLPLVLFEQQHRVDEEMARRALQVCPTPPEAPPQGADEKAVRRWGERVRRHLLLAAMTAKPAEVLPLAMARYEALRKTGLWEDSPAGSGPGESEDDGESFAPGPGDKDEPGVSSGEQDSGGEAPSGAAGRDAATGEGEDFLESFGFQNPLLTVQVLALAASMATGRIEEMARVLGGEEGLCSSRLVQGLALLQMLPFQTSALRLAQNRLLGPEVMGTVAGQVEELARRFEGRECSTPGALALLAVQSLLPEQVTALVERGEAPLLARLWRQVAPNVEVTGGERERQAVLRELATGPEFPGQTERRSQWAVSLLQGGNPKGALEVLEKVPAGTALPVRVWAWAAVEAGEGQASARGTEAIRAYMQQPPEQEDVLELLERVSPVEVQRYLVRRLGRYALEAGRPVAERRPVLRALMKLVDKAPGSPLAEVALPLVRKGQGWAEDPGEEVMLDLVATRHFLAAGRAAQAQATWRSALARIRPTMGDTLNALWMVALQVLREGREAWVRQAGARLAALPPGEPSLVSAVSVELARKGMRDLAIRLLRGATEQARRQQRDAATMASLADTWLLLNLPEEARKVTEGIETPEGERGAALLKARQALAEKDYRKALGILGSLLAANPRDIDVRYQQALARMLAGRAEEAEEDLRVCLREGGPNPMVLGALGYAQFDQGRYEEAESSFEEALELDEKEPDNLLGLALTRFRRGRLEEAREIWSRHLKSHPLFRDGVEAAEAAGYSYSEVQKQAWREFVEALSLPPAKPKPGR